MPQRPEVSTPLIVLATAREMGRSAIADGNGMMIAEPNKAPIFKGCKTTFNLGIARKTAGAFRVWFCCNQAEPGLPQKPLNPRPRAWLDPNLR